MRDRARQVSTVELQLEGTRAAVMWPSPGPHTPPPRVVIYAEQVWHFYRFTQPRIPENRAAWYKRVEPFRLAPGQYKPK